MLVIAGPSLPAGGSVLHALLCQLATAELRLRSAYHMLFYFERMYDDP
jgi:hypothetical protein